MCFYEYMYVNFFWQHCIDHLYFWYHNILLQLQHTCHKLFQRTTYKPIDLLFHVRIKMNVFGYWILLKSDQSVWYFLFFSLTGLNMDHDIVQKDIVFRLYGLFVRIPKKHYGMKICSLMEIFCCLLLYSWMVCWHWSCSTLFWRWDGIINIGS